MIEEDYAEMLDDWILSQTTCPRCEQKPGQMCVTISGQETNTYHTARRAPVYQAYDLGYNHALQQHNLNREKPNV